MNMMPYLFVARTEPVRTPNFQATTRACARVASNYPFAKLMEIAESVPPGRVRATSDKSDKRKKI